jgi:hypothetical protein
MLAEPGPEMRIHVLTSGSTVLADGGGAVRTRPWSTTGGGCRRPSAGICGKYAPNFVALTRFRRRDDASRAGEAGEHAHGQDSHSSSSASVIRRLATACCPSRHLA